MKRPILIIVFCLIITVVLAVAVISNNTAPKTGKTAKVSEVKEGNEAPDFTVTLNNGNTFTLSDYKDKVVLVNFWAT